MLRKRTQCILKLMLLNIPTHAHFPLQFLWFFTSPGSDLWSSFTLVLHFRNVSIRRWWRFANHWIVRTWHTLPHMSALRFVRQSKFHSSSPILFITRSSIRHCQEIGISDSDSRTISVDLVRQSFASEAKHRYRHSICQFDPRVQHFIPPHLHMADQLQLSLIHLPGVLSSTFGGSHSLSRGNQGTNLTEVVNRTVMHVRHSTQFQGTKFFLNPRHHFWQTRCCQSCSISDTIRDHSRCQVHQCSLSHNWHGIASRVNQRHVVLCHYSPEILQQQSCNTDQWERYSSAHVELHTQRMTISTIKLHNLPSLHIQCLSRQAPQ